MNSVVFFELMCILKPISSFMFLVAKSFTKRVPECWKGREAVQIVTAVSLNLLTLFVFEMAHVVMVGTLMSYKLGQYYIFHHFICQIPKGTNICGK